MWCFRQFIEYPSGLFLPFFFIACTSAYSLFFIRFLCTTVHTQFVIVSLFFLFIILIVIFSMCGNVIYFGFVIFGRGIFVHTGLLQCIFLNSAGQNYVFTWFFILFFWLWFSLVFLLLYIFSQKAEHVIPTTKIKRGNRLLIEWYLNIRNYSA